MYDARAIANFFIDRSTVQRSSLTIMTLLKVLYFSHAWYLAKYRKPLIAQPFEAWQHGPVNRVVYDQFKSFGDRPIDKKAVSFDPIQMKFLPTSYSFDHETSIFLENIFDYYSQFHPFKLSHLTHEKGGPWDKVWSQAERRAVPGMIIPNELIEAWFSDQRALYWTDRERRIAT
jgi:uncharacterized phage-associated protein